MGLCAAFWSIFSGKNFLHIAIPTYYAQGLILGFNSDEKRLQNYYHVNNDDNDNDDDDNNDDNDNEDDE